MCSWIVELHRRYRCELCHSVCHYPLYSPEERSLCYSVNCLLQTREIEMGYQCDGGKYRVENGHSLPYICLHRIGIPFLFPVFVTNSSHYSTMTVLQVNREDNDKRNDTTHNGNDDGARRSKNTLHSISNDIIYSSYQK